MTSPEQNDRMANAIRFLAMDAVEKANSGHPGMPMGMADVATVLFTKYLRFDPKKPHWPNRDRFVLSAGHGSMLLYSLLYLTGYPDMTVEDLKQFRQIGSKTAGHPEYGHATGIETTTGPLGQGIANAVGMAIAERKLRDEFGPELQDHYTYVINGDGCLMEGISHEAIALAGHLKLNKLILFWDNNSITIDGAVSLSDSTDQIARFKAVHWNTIEIDGHDQAAIADAIEAAHKSDRPTFIACKTVIGFGAPNKAGSHKVHGSPLGADEIAATRKALNWDYEPFVVPSDVLDAWRAAGTRSDNIVKAWEETLANSPVRAEFSRRMAGDLPEGFDAAITDYKKKLAETKPTVATRKASEDALEIINGFLPETLGGSADLTPSNNTKTSQMVSITPTDFKGRYMHWGIREHGMASAMNGISLHGGLIPYGGGFMIFSDYCRPPIRLSALMGIRVIHVLTHDSIGVGEDGPTHQPVEQIAGLRAVPNLQVFRPADAVETAECWQIAIKSKNRPSALALTRQNLTTVRTEYNEKNLCELGAYTLAGNADAKVTIFASGSEVEIAVAARATLEAKGVSVRVVSVPCTELFFEQPDAYRKDILGNSPVKIAVEAAVREGWDAFIGPEGSFVGMKGFGASGPVKDVYKHFGITADAVVAAAEAKL
ncbi:MULTISPECIES: transketolase [Rhizobium]|uniref:Transketolase n=2 Tax=Rhizobium TaxID=379 RepID=A0A2A5KMW4_9HYPH|nr:MULTISPECIES: transketolase [Rhizobium]AJC81004.1 transketolase [Rhizobium etli bv. phaseoli str. IE4803]AIC28858.1 transketolase 1 [Rhizobium sp. IE4771]ARQ59830.1 transketolase [Rhizobium sp. Kim5]PCK78394.1 transketolase [Rhizobium sophoriradicis]RSC05083.1 transketolase [Rhizobium sophoriradicis]